MKRTVNKFIIILTFLVCILYGHQVQAQPLSNGAVSGTISAETPFLDASTNFDMFASPNSLGKGLVFPRADLTTFTFKISSLDGAAFPSAFDGMLVYNVGTGNTLATQGVNVSTVTPGFYYFKNSNAGTDYSGTLSITGGTWVRFSDQMPSSDKSYYGVLATNTPIASDITGLTNKNLASGGYAGNLDLTISTAGYYTVALPASWRNPLLKIDGNTTLDIMQAVQQVVIGGVNYVVWQSDIELPIGQVVSIN